MEKLRILDRSVMRARMRGKCGLVKRGCGFDGRLKGFHGHGFFSSVIERGLETDRTLGIDLVWYV